MKTGVFGGTFNPIHKGHLTIARAAADAFALDRVLFVPASSPPWKTTDTPYEHRFRMVELACAADPRFEASRLEQAGERNYTIETIERLKAADAGELYFIIGADAFAEIRKWHRWEDLIKQMTFIVVSRPGHTYDVPPGARVLRLDTVNLPISSSAIRVSIGRAERSAELPAAVQRYIEAHSLYRSHSDS